MTERTAHILAIMIVACFFAVVIIVLVGLVDVSDPTIAKLIGVVFGYVSALLNPVIYRYFGGRDAI